MTRSIATIAALLTVLVLSQTVQALEWQDMSKLTEKDKLTLALASKNSGWFTKIPMDAGKFAYIGNATIAVLYMDDTIAFYGTDAVKRDLTIIINAASKNVVRNTSDYSETEASILTTDEDNEKKLLWSLLETALERLRKMQDEGTADFRITDALFTEIADLARNINWSDYRFDYGRLGDPLGGLSKLADYYYGGGKRYGLMAADLLFELAKQYPQGEAGRAFRDVIDELINGRNLRWDQLTAEEKKSLAQKALYLYRNYPSEYKPFSDNVVQVVRLIAPEILEEMYRIQTAAKESIKRDEPSSAEQPEETSSISIFGLSAKEAFKALVDAFQSRLIQGKYVNYSNYETTDTLLKEIRKVLTAASPNSDGKFPYDLDSFEYGASYGKRYGFQIIEVLNDLVRRYPGDNDLPSRYLDALERVIVSADASESEIPTQEERRLLAEKIYQYYVSRPDGNVSLYTIRSILDIVAPDVVKRLKDLAESRK